MKYIFLHIPKAAGSTIHKIFERIYNPDELFTIEVRDKKLHTDDFISSHKIDVANIKLLKGHMDFGLHTYFADSDVKYITFLRDPVERIASHYHYAKKHDNHYLHTIIHKQKMQLLDYALSDLSPELDNGMTRAIAGASDLKIKCSDEMLELAVKNIKEHFAVVGITEKFDDSLLLLADVMCLPILYYNRINENKEKEPVSNAEREQIKERNKFDVLLYEWAIKEFDARLQKIPELELKRKTLNDLNLVYNSGYSKGYRMGHKRGFKLAIEKIRSTNVLTRYAVNTYYYFKKRK